MSVWDNYFLACMDKYYCGDYASDEGTWDSCFYVKWVVRGFIVIRACNYDGNS